MSNAPAASLPPRRRPRRRLAQKLLLFYVLPLSVLLVAGFAIPVVLWSYFGRYTNEYRASVHFTEQIEAMGQAANNCESAVREYLFTRDKELWPRFRQERLTFTERRNDISSYLETAGTPRMPEMVDKLERNFRQWSGKADDVFQFQRRNGKALTAAQSATQSAAIRARFASVQTDLTALQRVAAAYEKQLRDRSNAAEFMRTVTSVTIPVTAILLTLLIGRSLALGITRPLEVLTDATEELEKGGGVLMVQQAETQMSADDEIGELQRAFLRMARTIGQREAMLRTQNDALGSLNQRVAAVLNATNDGIVLLDRTGSFSVVNQKFADLFGIEADALLDQTFAQAAPPLLTRFKNRAQVQERLERLINDPTAAADETFVMAEPTPRTLRMYTAPVRRESGGDGANELVGRIFVFRDVTRETEADRMKTEFVSMVSHELRTPLTAIKGYVDLMVTGQTGELNEVQTEFLTTVQDSARRLHALINDVLDISRIESGRMEVRTEAVDYIAVAEQAVKMMQQTAEQKNIALTLQVAGGTETKHPAVSGDADRITQVLVNLLSNGVKYTPEGGRVVCRIEFAHDFVTTCVEDTGIGLSLEEQKRLFQKFYRADNSTTRETGGTGLGLAITRAILEKSGGSIWVESEPGQGSRFWFTLPCVASTAQGTEAEGQYLTLSVDSDVTVLHRLGHELRRQGFVTANATTGSDALRRARSLRPDMILLNPLSAGLDGLELLRTLRERPETQATPIRFVEPRVGPGQADMADTLTLIPRSAAFTGLADAVQTALKGERGTVSVVVVGDADLARAVREAMAFDRDAFLVAAEAPAEADKAMGGLYPDLIVLDSHAAPGTMAGEWLARLQRQRPGERLPVALIVDPVLLTGKTQTLIPLGAGPLPLSRLGATLVRILEG